MFALTPASALLGVNVGSQACSGRSRQGPAGSRLAVGLVDAASRAAGAARLEIHRRLFCRGTSSALSIFMCGISNARWVRWSAVSPAKDRISRRIARKTSDLGSTERLRKVV